MDEIKESAPTPGPTVSRRSFLGILPMAAAVAPLAAVEAAGQPQGVDFRQALDFYKKASQEFLNSLHILLNKKSLDESATFTGAAGVVAAYPLKETEGQQAAQYWESPYFGKIKLLKEKKTVSRRKLLRLGVASAIGAGLGLDVFLSLFGKPGELNAAAEAILEKGVKHKPENIFKPSQSSRFSAKTLPVATMEEAVPKVSEPTPEPTLEPTKNVNPTTTPTKTPASSPTPTQTKPPTPTPEATTTPPPTATTEPTKSPEEIAGGRNIAEYFLGNLADLLKGQRRERYENDPAFAERVHERLLDSDWMSFVVLGTDETRERPDEFNGAGIGRSDMIKVISFNPNSWEIITISLPRDLYSPEMVKYFPKTPKINTMTAAGWVDPNADYLEITRRVVESATGVPIDGIIKVNIDFMQGYQATVENVLFEEGIISQKQLDFVKQEVERTGSPPEIVLQNNNLATKAQISRAQTQYANYWGMTPGIFDQLVPEGLDIEVTERIVDPTYPLGYGTIRLDIPPGIKHMNGREIVQWARSRKSGSDDYGRTSRQTEAALTLIRNMAPQLARDFALGKTDKLDDLIFSLENQERDGNLFFDLNIIEIIKTVKDSIQSLITTPEGFLALGSLVVNSQEQLDNLIQKRSQLIKTLGVDRSNFLGDVLPGERNYAAFMTKMRSKSTASPPTQLGNYLDYWQPLRDKTEKLYLS